MNKNTYKDLIVWQKAMDLVVAIYRLTDTFPKKELFALSSQLKRAAVSIPSNIAEGKLRGHSPKEWGRFIAIAYGSVGELETQLEIAKRVGYATEESLSSAEDLLREVAKILNTLSGSRATDASRLTPDA